MKPEKKIVAEALRGKEFESVLEVGCYHGESLLAVKEAFPKKRIIGLDKNEENVGKARELTGLEIIVGDALALPFGDKEFDAVFTSALFCMLEISQVELALDEIIRVAKKHILMVELDVPATLDVVNTEGRIGANWERLFGKRGIQIKKTKILPHQWDASPWIGSGYLIEASMEGR